MIQKFFAPLGYFIFLFWFVGCQTTGVVLKDTPLNVSETRRVIVSVIGEPLQTSENGRELISKYHNQKLEVLDRPSNASQRYYTHIKILGDRRPYDLQVEVFIEEKVDHGRFEKAGRDDRLAQDRAQAIAKALNESLDQRNIIDDFRPY